MIVLAASGWTNWSAVWTAIGSGIIAVAALALVIEVWLRRQLTEEVLASVDVREEIGYADISRVLTGTLQYQEGFAEALRKASDVDIMFISAAAWLDNHRAALAKMLGKKGRVRVLIPSADDEPLLTQLLTRFKYDTTDELAMEIKTTYQRVKALRDEFPAKTTPGPFPVTDAAEEQEIKTPDGARHEVIEGVSIRRLSVVPTYSFYRINDIAVMRVHEVRKDLAEETPVVVFGNRGSLWRFAMTDFDTLFDAADEYK